MNLTENIQEGYRNRLSKTALEFDNCKQQLFTRTMCLPARLWGQIARTPFNCTIKSQIFSAWWVTTILYSYGPTLYEPFYNDIVVGKLNDDSKSSNFSDVINLLMSHFWWELDVKEVQLWVQSINRRHTFRFEKDWKIVMEMFAFLSKLVVLRCFFVVCWIQERLLP